MKVLDLSAGQRAAILYNPVARTLSRHPELIRGAAKALEQQGFEVRVVPTTAPGSATEQVKEQIAEGCTLIVAAGGDGTINEVADGMLYTGVPLAIVPGGTANVLARELRLPIHAERAAAAITKLRAYRITTGSLRTANTSHRTFLCMAGIGLDADVISRLNQRWKARAGKFAYWTCGFSQVLRTLPEFEVVVDEKEYRASFALVSRVRNYGGDLEIARGASLLRDDFEIVLFRGAHAIQYIPYLVGVALRQVNRMRGVRVLQGKAVSCQAPRGQRVYMQVDGELVGQVPATIDTMPGALTLLAPAEFAAREQALAPSNRAQRAPDALCAWLDRAQRAPGALCAW